MSNTKDAEMKGSRNTMHERDLVYYGNTICEKEPASPRYVVLLKSKPPLL